METAAVVALKPAATAKSRLGALPDALRRRLAWAMAVDTLTALCAAGLRVLVVTSDDAAVRAGLRSADLEIEVITEVGDAGLNAAFNQGARHLAAIGYRSALACVADLPALRSESVRRVLSAASAMSRAFVTDTSGAGTTMLYGPADALGAHFEGQSAAAHAILGAAPLTDRTLGWPVPDARRDVDTEDDLVEATRIGLGPATAVLVDHGTGRVRRPPGFSAWPPPA